MLSLKNERKEGESWTIDIGLADSQAQWGSHQRQTPIKRIKEEIHIWDLGMSPKELSRPRLNMHKPQGNN